MTATLSLPFEGLVEGSSFETRGRTVTEADVVSFSALTWDHHPVHTDATYAEAGMFGGRIAHGMLVLSYALGLVPLDPQRTLALRRITNVTFRAPVALGDTMRVAATIARCSELSDDLGLVRLHIRVLKADDAVAVTGDIDALWAREGKG